MRSPPSRQRDLFEVDQKMLDIPNTQKPLLVSVLERMLVEALADDDATNAANDKAAEVADEQDHV